MIIIMIIVMIIITVIQVITKDCFKLSFSTLCGNKQVGFFSTPTGLILKNTGKYSMNIPISGPEW